MAFVSVKKNDQDEWEVFKYLTSNINQVSPLTGWTIGNLIYLDAAGRLEHGFWELNDIYVGTGEFMEFDNKTTVMDAVNCVVTNTYTYKRMDLAIIRDEMKNRVRGYRSQLAQGSYTKDGKDYDLSSEGRLELQGLVLEVLLDSSIQSVSIRIPSGEDIQLSAAEVKALYLEIALYRDGLYDTEAQIITAIDAAETYEDIRLVSKWGDQEL